MRHKGFKNRSVMKHKFSEIPQANIPRSNFRRSHGYKTTFDSGYLVPIYVDEALPGDTFKLTLSSIARMATPTVPVMDNIMMDFFFFAVPNRILWTNWVKFMGEQVDPGDSTDYNVPVVTTPVGGHLVGSVADYFGIPTEVDDVDPNSLHFRAYNRIWNDWFRSQDLQDSVTVNVGDGPDTDTDYTLLKRGKRHDYFTSCLPWPQKGTEIDLPLGTEAPVIGDGYSTRFWDGTNLAGLYNVGSVPGAGISISTAHDYVSIPNAPGPTGSLTTNKAWGLPDDGTNTGMIADLSNALAPSINSLREAFQLQRMLERDARGGTRYTEILKSHFRVESPDSRMQRPEYLGGGSKPVVIAPIPQTSETNTTVQGTLAAIGFHQQSGIGFTKSFTEHCVIIGLVNVRCDLTYQTGV